MSESEFTELNGFSEFSKFLNFVNSDSDRYLPHITL